MKNIRKIAKTWSLATAITSVLLLGTGRISAQTAYRADAGKETEVQVRGTSNVHNWTMSSVVADSHGVFKLNSKDEIISVSSLIFSMPVKSLKSGKSLMDSRTYKSLRADEFPNISYQLKSFEIIMVQPSKFRIETRGSITIAGKTQPIAMVVNAVINADRSITCTGSTALKLTDFGIEPPSFMLGAMKVGNELTIKFNLTYNKSLSAK